MSKILNPLMSVLQGKPGGSGSGALELNPSSKVTSPSSADLSLRIIREIGMSSGAD
ncbi:MAG: hypothetical protein ACLPXB_10505 [Thiobacillaceae bacterium]